MIWTIVKRHFVTQRHIIIPFILSSSTIFAIEYILLSLTTNTYIQQHQQLLGVFAIIGNVFMSLLAIIFIIYANQFVIKQQQKTYSLYIILGMENSALSKLEKNDKGFFLMVEGASIDKAAHPNDVTGVMSEMQGPCIYSRNH